MRRLMVRWRVGGKERPSLNCGIAEGIPIISTMKSSIMGSEAEFAAQVGNLTVCGGQNRSTS